MPVAFVWDLRRKPLGHKVLEFFPRHYLAQMSAADYLEKLPRLYQEFVEAFDSNQIPPEKRAYQNLRALLEKSPGFWNNYVRPLLDTGVGGAYHYLSPDGKSNSYVEAVEANLAELQLQLKSSAA
jgi:hypothetical protein